jgi:Mg2+/citrate symporter
MIGSLMMCVSALILLAGMLAGIVTGSKLVDQVSAVGF